MANVGSQAPSSAQSTSHSVWANSIVSLTNARKRHRQLDHIVAGTGAGFISTISLHPLDVVKTRFQAYEGRTGIRGADQPMYRTTFAALRHILKTEGFTGVYRGISPALWGSGLAWGLYFGIYENAKSRHLRNFEQQNGGGASSLASTQELSDSSRTDEEPTPIPKLKLPTFYHLASGVEAGAICVLLTNPIWLIKTRLQLQGANGAPYRGMIHAAACIVREEGPLALYRGIGPALVLVSNGAIQFGVYEELKHFVISHQDTSVHSESQLTSIQFLGMGAVSKVIASVITYPLQVVKTRIQQRQTEGQVKYSSMGQSCQRIFAKEGARGFYKGLGPTLLRVAPQSAITFAAYENVKRLLQWVAPT